VCVAQPFFDRKVRCAVNPAAAREAELAETLRTPADTSRRVLVVGGGPAGMEAARVAALRGHDVVLCEDGAQLGGTLRFAALPYEPNERLLRWLETQVRKLPIELRLDEKVSPELVRELAPDVVIAAVGATRERPDIPGVDRPHVFDGDDLRALLTGEASKGAGPALSLSGRLAVAAGRLTGVTSDPSKLRAASKAYMPVGRRVVIVGGGLVGVELAEFLAERGREVAVIEEGPVLALEMAHPRRWRVLHDLREAGVTLVSGARVLEIGAAAVRFETDAGAESAPADTVILATGLEANRVMVSWLECAGVPLVSVGDGDTVGYIEGAIRTGFEAAIEI
jgi:NADPH-dependent 2,4-dienoyl-CoA reductase/sulfur reductase-like enzyme